MDDRAVRIKQFWEERAKRIEDPRTATRFHNHEAIAYDVEFIRHFCAPESSVLDLGAGTCEVTSQLASHVRRITAVDFVEGLLTKRELPDNVARVVSDIREFETDERYDLILLFGVYTYILGEDEVISLSEKVAGMLADGGLCIIKHQIGVRETVLVDRYSQEFGTRYVAVYRQLDQEIALLRRVFDVDPVDIYPPHLNRWDDTHYYAFVCRAKSPVSIPAPPKLVAGQV